MSKVQNECTEIDVFTLFSFRAKKVLYLVKGLVVSDALDRLAVFDLFNVYADALDNRKWSDLDDVFDLEVTVNYGGAYFIRGRPNVVAMIRSFLDPCGRPSTLWETTKRTLRATALGHRSRCACITSDPVNARRSPMSVLVGISPKRYPRISDGA